MSSSSPSSIGPKRRLLNAVVCPRCWTQFPPENALWIAESQELLGDYKLGEMERVRFLPTQFTADGFAIDAKGFPCKDLACPHCHLRLPTAALEAPSTFMSIVGAPASGKSYFLASSIWTLRKTLPRNFSISFQDADPEMNAPLQRYEALHFLNESDQIAQIEKTETEGDLYDVVKQGDENIVYPRSFVFLASKTSSDGSRASAATVNLYDNAGESWLPTRDADSATFPATRHIARSRCIFFIYDPTQDARFRAVCRQFSNDPQLGLGDADALGARRKTDSRQELVLSEMIKRVRSHRQMRLSDRYTNPLIVVVSKFDIWRSLTPTIDSTPPIDVRKVNGTRRAVLRTDKIRAASAAVRRVLLEHTPEFPLAAEQFASNVVYIPTSATGVSPVHDAKTNQTGFRAKDLKPIWADVPMLYALSQTTKGVVPTSEE
ncbi:MAG: hypothetical protein IJE97_06020 [Thermoguttaceae bacterium]|nr:hypothetical protein [Thermoguttaceae bacterium]